jgi:protein required for attachment to host cells
MKQEKLGYVVADGGRAKLVLRHGSGRYETLTELHGEHLHRPRLDSRTRVFERFGNARSAVGDLGDQRAGVVQAFVAEVDEAVEKAVAEGAFNRFVLAAPPRVLGALRARLKPELQRRVVCEFPKDLTKLPEAELHQRLESISLLGR